MVANDPRNTIDDYIAVVADAVSASYHFTIALLCEPFAVRAWLKLAVPVWLIQMYGIAGYVLASVSGGAGALAKLPAMHDVAAVSAWISGRGGRILIAILIGIIICGWISVFAEFVFLERLVAGKRRVRLDFRRHARSAWSFFCWRFAVYGSAVMAGMVTIVITVVVAARTQSAWRSDPAAAVILVAAILLMAVVGLIIVSSVRFLLHDIMLPLMFVTRSPGGAAFRYAVRLASFHWKGMFLLWLVIGFAELVVHMFYALVVLVTFGLVLVPFCVPWVNVVWHALVTVALLPIAAFFRMLGPFVLGGISAVLAVNIKRTAP